MLDPLFRDELLDTITQEPPFQFVDDVLEINPDGIQTKVRFGLKDFRCTSDFLDSWLCVEMLAQAAEIHTRWLTKAKKANGLLVGIDNLQFYPQTPSQAGELTLEARRGEQIGMFLKYHGLVKSGENLLADGEFTIYNVGHD